MDYQNWRNVSSFQFDAERIEPFVDAIAPTFSQVQNEIAAFATFLQNQA
jgi:hypothetical protein